MNMRYIDQNWIERVCEELNQANARVRQSADAVHACRQQLQSLESSLQSARYAANGAQLGLGYGLNHALPGQRIDHLESQLAQARARESLAQQALALERRKQQSGKRKAEQELGQVRDALRRVEGNLQTIRYQTGRPARELQQLLKVEEDQHRRLQDSQARLLDVLNESQNIEQNSMQPRGGLEGIISGMGSGNAGLACTGFMGYVRQDVYVHQTARYSVEQQLAANPYTYSYSDNYTPLNLREPSRYKQMLQSTYARTLYRLGHYWR